MNTATKIQLFGETPYNGWFVVGVQADCLTRNPSLWVECPSWRGLSNTYKRILFLKKSEYHKIWRYLHLKLIMEMKSNFTWIYWKKRNSFKDSSKSHLQKKFWIGTGNGWKIGMKHYWLLKYYFLFKFHNSFVIALLGHMYLFHYNGAWTMNNKNGLRIDIIM